jgi:hypothetical protein
MEVFSLAQSYQLASRLFRKFLSGTWGEEGNDRAQHRQQLMACYMGLQGEGRRLLPANIRHDTLDCCINSFSLLVKLLHLSSDVSYILVVIIIIIIVIYLS